MSTPIQLQFDIYVDGQLFSQCLTEATLENVCKLPAADLIWAMAEKGVCTLLDDSGREVKVTPHGGIPDLDA